MGTETCHTRHDNLQYIRRVKLNNPLMGTETISHFVLHPPYDLSIVKLNNPLMGTETRFLIASIE